MNADDAGPGASESHRHEALLQEVMGRQAALGIRVAAGFVVLLIGLPALSYFLPEIASTNVLGFPLAWFILGILFYPITWGLSYWFVRSSDAIEHDIAVRYGSGSEVRGVDEDRR